MNDSSASACEGTARPGPDYYQILGVDRTATEQVIKDAFQKLAAEYQAGPANIEAVERFRKIARAYRVLSDSEQRKHYDRLGEAGIIEQPLDTKIDPDILEKWGARTYSNPFPVNDWPGDFIEYLKNRK